jgi:hypothetical protein
MPRVRIVQLLCPSRHCLVAAAYTSPDGLAIDHARTLLMEWFSALRTAGAGEKCGICGSGDFTFEDAPTVFATMEEAEPYLRHCEAQNAAVRQFFAATKN